MKILVVEDETLILAFLERGLTAEGHAVDTASRGEDGLDRVRDGRPDVIVLDVMLPGIDGFDVLAAIRAIDPANRTVQTDAGEFAADVLVVALGADLDPAATPGLMEGGHEFYTVSGGFSAREVLDRFQGGRVVIGVLSTPYKCPPAPSETALLLHEYLVARGLREKSEIALVIDFGRPIPPSPDASAALLEAFAERDIEWHPSREVHELDTGRNVALLRDGGEMP